MYTPSGVTFQKETVGPWTLPVAKLQSANRQMRLPVFGKIINSSPSSNTRPRFGVWKAQIAREIKEERGGPPWDHNANFAVTLGLSFCMSEHGGANVRLDIDNFTKPIFDGLAAGLLCANETEPSPRHRFNYDDSNFNVLLIQRLSDAENVRNEGVAIYVSAVHP